MNTENSILQGSEEEVRGTILAFEDILEAMPNDRIALETLFEGHLMLEQQDQAAEYLARLATTIIEEDDSEALQCLLPALHQHAGINEEVAAVLNQADSQLKASKTSGRTDFGTENSDPSAGPDLEQSVENFINGDITAELSMAWNVHQAGELSEEEYAAVVHDLSELSHRSTEVPVTVLHVLADQNSSSLEKVTQFISRDTNTPFIRLRCFELDSRVIDLALPEPMVRSSGALVYEVMAEEAMVAILNPYDEALKQRVSEVLDRTCHFFLTSPEEYDAAIRKLYRREQSAPTAPTLPGEKKENSGKKAGLRLKT